VDPGPGLASTAPKKAADHLPGLLPGYGSAVNFPRYPPWRTITAAGATVVLPFDSAIYCTIDWGEIQYPFGVSGAMACCC
jgi:hypothetical protein